MLKKTLAIAFTGRLDAELQSFLIRNDGQEDLYLSSADWMGRNLFRRIEIAFPILDPKIKRRVIRESLRPYLVDNVQAWEMQSDGRYRRKTSRAAKPRSAQAGLLADMAAKQRN